MTAAFNTTQPMGFLRESRQQASMATSIDGNEH